MRQYDDINEYYRFIIKEIQEHGNLIGKRRELPFQVFTLTNLDHNILFFPTGNRNWGWVLRECSDRISNIKNPGESYKFSKLWENRKQVGDKKLYSYHYSNRMDTQLRDLLSKKKHSRDKILTIWSPEDLQTNLRQPCTIIMQPFQEHDGKFSLVVYMRNNDMINIFPSDIFIHSTYFKYWTTKLELEYKNIYWVSAIAYYPKKRDTVNYINRMLSAWKHGYNNIPCEKWSSETISDFEMKEIAELKLLNGEINIDDAVSYSDIFKTQYIKEWYLFMVNSILKMQKKKTKQFDYQTEFKLLNN